MQLSHPYQDKVFRYQQGSALRNVELKSHSLYPSEIKILKSHLQYWAQDLHSVINKTDDDRCDVTIYDRYAKINTDSFDGKPNHIQKAETTIYNIYSKIDSGVGAGFIIYHKSKRMHAESTHMPDISTVFQAKIEAISHACQYVIGHGKDENLKYIKILSDSQAAII